MTLIGHFPGIGAFNRALPSPWLAKQQSVSSLPKYAYLSSVIPVLRNQCQGAASPI